LKSNTEIHLYSGGKKVRSWKKPCYDLILSGNDKVRIEINSDKGKTKAFGSLVIINRKSKHCRVIHPEPKEKEEGIIEEESIEFEVDNVLSGRVRKQPCHVLAYSGDAVTCDIEAKGYEWFFDMCEVISEHDEVIFLMGSTIIVEEK